MGEEIETNVEQSVNSIDKENTLIEETPTKERKKYNRMTREDRMLQIEQPNKATNFDIIGSFSIGDKPLPISVYAEQGNPDNKNLYVCGKYIQDYLGERRDYDALMRLIKDAIKYPDIAFGVEPWSSSLALFMSLEGFKFFTNSRMYVKHFATKIKIYEAFEKYANEYHASKQKQAMQEEEPAQQSSQEVPVSGFKMFDENNEVTEHTSSNQKDQSEDPDLSSVFSSIIEKAKQPLNEENKMLYGRIKELDDTIKALNVKCNLLEEENKKLQSGNYSNVTFTDNGISKMLYTLADQMPGSQIDVCNVVMRSVQIRASMSNDYDKIWGRLNSKVRNHLIENGYNLDLFDYEHNNNLSKEEKDKYKNGRKSLKNIQLYEYMCCYLGLHKKLISILYNIFIECYSDASSMVDAVKWYFNIDNTNAAIHWLRRFGIPMAYQDE